MPLARTTFTPWQEVEMSDREYADLDAQGLIYREPAVPVAVEEPKPRPRLKPTS